MTTGDMTEPRAPLTTRLKTFWSTCICRSRWTQCGASGRPPGCCSTQRVMAAFKGVWNQGFWRSVAAEFTATLVFVLISLGSTVDWAAATAASATAAEEKAGEPGGARPRSGAPDPVLISLCFGLSVATLVQCFGHVSGAHLNPAVTAAMVVTRNMSLAKAVCYMLAQCLGSVVGAAVLYGVTPESVRGSLGVTMVNSRISVGHALVVELFITFQLVFTVFASIDPKRSDLGGSCALAIGLSVCIGHLFAIPYTGASMNPARSFGPAVVTWSWENHWVYWVAPVLGGILAAAFYEYLFCPNSEMKRRYSRALSKAPFTSTPYCQVQARLGTDLLGKEPLFTIMDMEQGRRKQSAPEIEVLGEVLSSV